MNFLWRFLFIIVFSHFQKKIHLMDKTSIHCRVLPTDIDILFHLNNGRYFSFLDLARTNYIIRTPFFSEIRKQKIYSVVASEMIRFKKSLSLWKKFEITTELIGWDEKFFYVAHQFKTKNTLHAVALIKGVFMKKNRSLPVKEIFALMDTAVTPPPLPEWVKLWLKADIDFYQANIHKK